MRNPVAKNTRKVNFNGAKPDHAEASALPAVETGPGSQPHLHFHTSGEDISWFAPAIRKQVEDEARALLVELKTVVPDDKAGVWQVVWDFVVRARAACQELENVEEEARRLLEERGKAVQQERSRLDEEIVQLSQKRDAVGKDLAETRVRFAQAMGEAGLPWNGGEPSVAVVENAIGDAAAMADEIAGEHHVVPVEKHSQGGVLAALASLLPAASVVTTGFLIALCLGSIVGLVTMAAIKRGDVGPLALMTAAGCVIVGCMGSVFQNTTVSLFYSREERLAEGTGAPPCPRRMPVVIAYIAAALSLWLAEVVAEALGLRLLFEQNREASFGAAITDPGTLPYYLAGALISGPYIWSKTVSTWRACEDRLRGAWLSSMRLKEVRGIRARRQTVVCVEHAARAEERARILGDLEGRVADTKTRREAVAEPELSADMRARLDTALGAALGESQRLHHRVSALLAPTSAAPQRRGIFGR